MPTTGLNGCACGWAYTHKTMKGGKYVICTKCGFQEYRGKL